MIDYIVEPFEYSFMVKALIVSVVVGVMCPVLGAYVITRGRAFLGDALATPCCRVWWWRSCWE